MKNITLSILALVSTGLLSCTKEEISSPQKNAAITDTYIMKESDVPRPAIRNIPGSYNFQSFIQNNRDHTRIFQNTVLTFDNTGALTFYNGIKNIQGSWSYNSTKNRIKITIQGNEMVDMLNNENWEIVDLLEVPNELQAQEQNPLFMRVNHESMQKRMDLKKIKLTTDTPKVLTHNE